MTGVGVRRDVSVQRPAPFEPSGRTIRVPVHMNDRIRKVYAVAHALETELGRRPNAAEIAAELEMDVEKVELALKASRRSISLEKPVGHEGESALEWLGLSDVVPATIHFTGPRSRRSRGSVPGVTLHTTSRPPTSDEVTVRNGVRMTTAVRTITDVAASGTAPEQVIAAIRQSLARGLMTTKGLLAASEDQCSRVVQLIGRGLDAA